MNRYEFIAELKKKLQKLPFDEIKVVAIALIITVLSVLLSFFITGIALFAGGLASVVAGFLVILQSAPSTLFYIGIGLMCLGIGAAIIIATAYLSKNCIRWLTKKIASFVLRREQK